jgi:hypothetical protein
MGCNCTKRRSQRFPKKPVIKKTVVLPPPTASFEYKIKIALNIISNFTTEGK